MTTPQDPFSTPPQSTSPGSGAAPDATYGAPPPGQPAYGQPAYGQPAYGQPGPGGAPRNGLGVAALVLGILALLTSITIVGGIVLGLIALILGVLGRGRAKRREANNGGMALAGIILGVLGIVLSVAIIAAGASFLNSDTGRQLTDCIESAGNDPAAQQQCERELTEKFTG